LTADGTALRLPRVRFRRGSVALVGAGPGAPDLMSLRAAAYLSRADCIVYDRLSDRRMLSWARQGAERRYVGKRPGDGPGSQERIQALLRERASRSLRVVRLKGGDPFVYGRGFEELQDLARHGIPVEVVPGISSVTGGLASARIPPVHRGTASTFAVFPGREAREKGAGTVRLRALARSADTLVGVMALERLPQLVEELRRVRGDAEPAALVESGATARERVLRAPLGRLVAAARRCRFAPPVLLVVGPVAALRASAPSRKRSHRPVRRAPDRSPGPVPWRA
jgi:uroporphyrin-III C-methyltransferase